MRVDGAGRLDEDQDLRLREQCAGEHEPLALTARERAAALLHVAVEPLGQRVEDVLGVGDGDRLDDLVVRGAAPRVELLAQRAGEEERVRLADDDAPPQLRERERRDRDAAERDETVVDEAAEPVCEPGALVGTGRDDAREHAGLDDESRPRVCEQRSLRRCRLEHVGLADSGSIRMIASIRCAPTSARVTLSTASAATRSGITRKAA